MTSAMWFLLVGGLLLARGLTSPILTRLPVTPAILYLAVGLLVGPTVFNVFHFNPLKESALLEVLTEVAVLISLFSAGVKMPAPVSFARWRTPILLATVSMTVSVGLVAAFACLVLGLPLGAAVLLGAILAPTDAALGLPIFNNRRVPVRIRRALNIESGLNDGIATPFVLLFVVFATATEEGTQTSGNWLSSALIEIAIAVVVGTAIGVAGGYVLRQTTRRGWTGGGSEQLAILGLALAAYFGSVASGGNGFIAAFVGGIVFRAATRNQFVEPTEFTETFGAFLSLLVWTIFGAVLMTALFSHAFDWRPLAYALLSLTVVRMAPVALAMLGAGLRRDTVALMGWFGPRGLASVVFTLLALEHFQAAGRSVDTLVAAATWTILLSVMLHGLTATPLAAWYAHRLAVVQPPPAELTDMSELHQRHKLLTSRSQMP